MSRTPLPTPKQPDERGSHAGRDFWLWLPDAPPPWPAMVILHGAGSAKENHADFARLCAAAGWAALSYDQRGHGEGADPMAPAALADVGRMARLLAERDEVDERRDCVRGSSMGGFLAIQAAASSAAIAGVIAICPASAEGLRRGLRSGELEMRADVDALDAWLGEHDLTDAVGGLEGKPLILLHARGDDRVPYTDSEELFAAASEPRKLIILPGGTHRSVQHDPELQGVALRWLTRALDGR
ncbi:MAG TPA: alpha/beta hydrolase [Solirubrobacterales bacterium]|nr:alpha/beta hydrolase [Solirubrobacterales bacterium]